jgi:hypothetical protein
MPAVTSLRIDMRRRKPSRYLVWQQDLFHETSSLQLLPQANERGKERRGGNKPCRQLITDNEFVHPIPPVAYPWLRVEKRGEKARLKTCQVVK